MLKRLYAFLLGLFLVYHCGYAQGIIHGVVLDPSNKPLAGANVLLLHPADSSLTKGMVTNELGVYSFGNVKPGPYILSFSAAGHEKAVAVHMVIATAGFADLGGVGRALAAAFSARAAAICTKLRRLLGLFIEGP